MVLNYTLPLIDFHCSTKIYICNEHEIYKKINSIPKDNECEKH